ncbi:MAG: ARPP-1 family domain-containing protein [Candidatus Xenobia bacterium]
MTAPVDHLRDVLQSGIRLGDPMQHRSVTLFPIFPIHVSTPPFDYEVLDEAVRQVHVIISEKPGATVPELLLRNVGSTMVLGFEGQEVVGGRQNRILNTTVLVDSQREVALPVSCVEQHRWHSTGSDRFRTGESLSSHVRFSTSSSVTASLRTAGNYRSDQSAIWSEIRTASTSLGSHSSTGALHAIYESRRADLEAFNAALPFVDGAIGLLVGINGSNVGLDIFDRTTTAAKCWSRLVRSYVLDALLSSAQRVLPQVQAESMLLRGVQADAQVFPSPGLGDNVRLTGGGIIGSALVYRNRPLHIGIFRNRKDPSVTAPPDATRSHLRRLFD